MAVLLQNRTLSMILMVPDVEVLVPSSSSSHIVEKLDRSDTDQQNETTSSMPVYHGSIVRIEQHTDDQTTSDLIVRVPNFQRLSLPSITISSETSDIDSKRQTRIKRRAPICPIINGSLNLSDSRNKLNLSNVNNTNQCESHVANTSRLTTGLRSLSRAFTHGCKSKRSSSISEITFPPTLPDVEVMTDKVQIPISSRKSAKFHNLTSSMPKLIAPKLLSIKRKDFKIKKKHPSSISIDTSTDIENNRINLTPTSTIKTTQYSEITKNKEDHSPKMTTFFQRFVNNYHIEEQLHLDNEQDNQTASIQLNYEIDQQLTTISQSTPSIPISSIDADSLSTHRYSTISAIAPDIQTVTTENDISLNIVRPFRVQTSILQPDISVVRVGTTDLTTEIGRLLPGEKRLNEQIDSITDNQAFIHLDIEQKQQDRYPNDETFAECYEVTYQVDPQYQNSIDNEKEQIQDQSSLPIKINLDPFEYKSLTSALTTWLPILPLITPNEYEQIEHDSIVRQNDRKHQQFQKRDHSLEYLETIPKEQGNHMTRMKSRSVDDLSRTSNDQTSTYQAESTSVSSTSELSPRHCTLRRSNSYNGFGIYVSTDTKTRREHFIRQVEQMSPGEQAGLKENDRILCINGTSVVNEDYTVVLQLIKHGLQTDTLHFDVMTDDAYNEFKSQIDQLYQSTKNDE